MRRGEVYLAQLQNTNGNIQQGLRPVLVLQNNAGNLYAPTTIVCSITTAKKKPLPTHVKVRRGGGLKKTSTVLCEQIHTINKRDLKKYLGRITNQGTLTKINRALLTSLGVI